MDHYSSCLDRAFLPRGLAMYRSLVKQRRPFRLWVLCFDDASYRVLNQLALDHLVAIHEEELFDNDLRALRETRSSRQYYFSSKPWLNLHVFERDPTAERVTFLDSDLYFFSDPSEMHANIAQGSVALSPHRAQRRGHAELFGVYNAGLCSFTRDDVGMAALVWWRQRCLEACPDYPVDGLFTDQKYLERLPHMFERVIELTSKGVNLAPWNISSSGPFAVVDGNVTADGDRLVIFHFHGLKSWGGALHDPGWTARGSARVLRDAVYRPYLAELAHCERVVARSSGVSRARPAPWGTTRPRPWWWRRGRAAVELVHGLVSRRLIWTR